MNPSHSFESLAGVFPGVTTVAEVTLRFGPPIVSDSSDGGLYLSFESRGIHVIVDAAHRDAADPLVDEVRFTQPSKDELPCGVRIGQPQDKAIKAVRGSYRITDEYDDAVYFRPSARDDLLASVEFRHAGVVVGVELYQLLDDGGSPSMLFTTDIAGLVAGQLSRFVTLNRHQLAGQVENLNFWLAEVHHALDMIDGYGVRFVRLHAAQERYVATYSVTMSEVGPGGVIERSPAEVRRIPDRDLQKARRALVESASRFLERCVAEGLLSADQVSAELARLYVGQGHVA